MWRRSSRRCTVIPSAPPKCASTAAHTGSGSYVRRAWRSVATWSMFTPSSIMFAPHTLRFVLHGEQIAHHPSARERALLEVIVEYFPHQSLRLGGRFGRTVIGVGERQQRRAAYLRIPASRLGGDGSRSALERVIVACVGIDRLPRVRLVRERQRVTELG